MIEAIDFVQLALYLFLVVFLFSESCLTFGFLVPGDSFIFTLGFLASQGDFNIVVIMIGATLACMLGNSAAYIIGKKSGRHIFENETSYWFQRKHLERARHFYKKYGKRSIIMASFIPIARTFTPVVAGMLSLKYAEFLLYNFFGTLVWVLFNGFLGYALGAFIPGIERYIHLILFSVIILALAPSLTVISMDRSQLRDFALIAKKNVAFLYGYVTKQGQASSPPHPSRSHDGHHA